jgi:hypothetical protein
VAVALIYTRGDLYQPGECWACSHQQAEAKGMIFLTAGIFCSIKTYFFAVNIGKK